MFTSARVLLLFTCIAAGVRATPNQFVARYLPIGASGSAAALAADASGNFFVVATVQEPSGQLQIRAIKTDGQGNILASFDFGGTSFTSPDAPTAAAVDPQGNLVIVGTTELSGFPVGVGVDAADEHPIRFCREIGLTTDHHPFFDSVGR